MENEIKENKIPNYFWRLLAVSIFMLVVVLPLLVLSKNMGLELQNPSFVKLPTLISETNQMELSIQETTEMGVITFQLPKTNAKSGDVLMSCDTLNQRIYLTFADNQMKNVEQGIIFADNNCVSKAFYSITDQGTTIVFELKGYYLANASQMGDVTKITMTPLEEETNPLIIIDLSNPTDEMEEITSLVVDKLQAQNVQVLISGTEQNQLTSTEVIHLSNELNIAMYIGIEMAPPDALGEAKTTTICNADYFLPGLNSIALADKMEYHTVEQLGGKPGGVIEYDEAHACLADATIPACIISLGYQMDESGVCSVMMPEYRELAARGICDGIMEALKE